MRDGVLFVTNSASHSAHEVSDMHVEPRIKPEEVRMKLDAVRPEHMGAAMEIEVSLLRCEPGSTKLAVASIPVPL